MDYLSIICVLTIFKFLISGFYIVQQSQKSQLLIIVFENVKLSPKIKDTKNSDSDHC